MFSSGGDRMSWLGRVFSNPVKTVADITTFGGTFALRSIPIKGVKKFGDYSSNIIGGGTIGAASGAASGLSRRAGRRHLWRSCRRCRRIRARRRR